MSSSDDETGKGKLEAMWVAKMIVNYPYLTAICSIGFWLVLGGIAFLSAGYDQGGGNGSFFATKETIVQHVDIVNALTEAVEDKGVEPQQTESKEDMVIIYKPEDGGNVFTVEHIQRIAEMEQALLDIEGWNDFCLKTNVTDPVNSPCRPPLSPVGLFGGCSDQACIDAIISSLIQTDDSGEKFISPATSDGRPASLFFGKDVDFDSLSNPVTRSIVYFGGPLKGYKNLADRKGEQGDLYDDYFNKWIDEFEKFEGEYPELDVAHVGDTITSLEINAIVNKDFALAAFSFVLVYAFVALQTQSLFLATFGMTHVVSSYVGAYFIYRVILQIEISPSINNLALFIILGIGADDIFVFVDAWKQSAHDRYEITSDLALRMTIVYKRAAYAMLVTSFTTFVSFVATAIAPIPMMSAFGVMAACVILVNFILVITYFPAIVILWDRKLAHQCCGRPVTNNRPAHERNDPMEGHEKVQSSDVTASEDSPVKGVVLYDFTGREKDEVTVKEGMVVKCIDNATKAGPNWVKVKLAAGRSGIMPASYVQLLVPISSGEVASTSCESDSGDEAAPEVPPREDLGESTAETTETESRTPVEEYTPTATEEQQEEEDSVEMAPAREAAEGSTSVESGTPRKAEHTAHANIEDFRFVERFFYGVYADSLYRLRYVTLVLFSLLAVAFIVGATQLRPPDVEPSGLPEEAPVSKAIDWLAADFAVDPSVEVSVMRFVWGTEGEYMRVDADGNKLDGNDVESIGTPKFYEPFTMAPPEAQALILDTCEKISAKSCPTCGDEPSPDNLVLDGEGSTRCFMAGFRDYLVARNRTFPAPEGSFNGLLVEFLSSAEAFQYVEERDVGVDEDGRPYYAIIAWDTPIARRPPNKDMRAWYDIWEAEVDALPELESLGPCFHSTRRFAWMRTTEVLSEAVYLTIFVSVVLAYIVLTLATQNIVISTLATIGIVVIVAGIISVMVVIGWELSFTEAIGAMMLVGLAVDYTVHLATSFAESEAHISPVEDDRKRWRFLKVRHALTEMGVSVVGGAVTTVSSGLVLFFTSLPFFQVFGRFIFITIILALVISLTYFMSLLMVLGPLGNQGKLSVLWKYLFKMCKK